MNARSTDWRTVSVIIPVFNDLAGLLRCLDGLERQTYPASKIQVVVVDNGSTPPISINGSYLSRPGRLDGLR